MNYNHLTENVDNIWWMGQKCTFLAEVRKKKGYTYLAHSISLTFWLLVERLDGWVSAEILLVQDTTFLLLSIWFCWIFFLRRTFKSLWATQLWTLTFQIEYYLYKYWIIFIILTFFHFVYSAVTYHTHAIVNHVF